MGGTLDEKVGKPASNLGEPSIIVTKIDTVGGENFSEPILLAGRKVVSLQADTLSATDIVFEGANFSSDVTNDAANQKDGFVIPLAADFSPLHDQSDTAVAILATTGDTIWALPDVGFPLWIRINLSAAQAGVFH